MADLTPEDWFHRLSAMFVSPTRPQWQDRLTRPSVAGVGEGARTGLDEALHIESSHFCRIAIGQEAKKLMRLHADAMRGSGRHPAQR